MESRGKVHNRNTEANSDLHADTTTETAVAAVAALEHSSTKVSDAQALLAEGGGVIQQGPRNADHDSGSPCRSVHGDTVAGPSQADTDADETAVPKSDLPAVAADAALEPSSTNISAAPTLLGQDDVVIEQGQKDEDHHSGAETHKKHSVVGDSVSGADTHEDQSAVAARRRQRVAPRTPVHRDPNRSRGESSKWNSEWEVGNFGLFFGNWGMIGTLGGQGRRTDRILTQYRQILKSLAQVVVLCEENESVEQMLGQPAVAGSCDKQGLEGRSTHKRWVVRGDEPQTVVLVAARKDNTDSLESLDYDVHDDHTHREATQLTKWRDR